MAGRLAAPLAVLAAIGVVVVALLLPVGHVFLRSVQVEVVTTKDGRVLRAVGEVEDLGRTWGFAIQPDPQGDRIPLRLPKAQVASVETRFSLEHYAHVLGDARTRQLVLNSILLAAGSALAALLLGLPVAWLLARTNLPGRRLLAALCLGPAILPPFFVAMGGARPLGTFLSETLGLGGGTLQLVQGMVVFGCVLFPLVALIVGRALARVPAGAHEAALLLGGRGAAWRRVVLPAVLPAVLGACVLVFVLAISDFAVPDLLGFMLPVGSTPTHVFATEIRLQWEQVGNTGRAVATSAPLVLVTLLLVGGAVLLLRRAPLVPGGEARRTRAPVRLGRGTRLGAHLLLLLVLAFTFAFPTWGVVRWGLGAGESVARPGAGAAPTAEGGRLFDLERAFRNTPGLEDDLARWIETGVAAALLATLVGAVLARWAIRSGRLVRGFVLALGALPLAVPGVVLTVGTLLLWTRWDVPFVERGIGRSVLALTARFLPFALLACWLALREVRRGHEEAAAVLGAPPVTRALRIWGPQALPGLLAGALLVLVLALREIDAVILIDTRILPLRLYDKIHFSRLADEATLALLYVGILLVPALALALLAGLTRRRSPERGPRPPS